MEKDFETKGERTARIIRTIVRHLHDVSIRQLSFDIGCNYMQLYYCSIGKTFELSDELVDAFRLKYPEFSESFLRYGTGKLIAANNNEPEEEENENKNDEQELPFGTPTPATIINPIGVDELTRLFSRVLDLVDDVRTREAEIRSLKQELSNIQQRLARLEGKQTEPK